MNLLHVLENVGKGALHLAGVFVPGPVGLIAKTVDAVVTQSTTDNANADKKAAAVAAVAPMAPGGKLEDIANVVEAIYQLLKSIAVLFPPKPAAISPTPPATS